MSENQIVAQSSTAMAAAEQTRAMQEVQAAFVMANQFPRNEVAAERKIIEACKRMSLAEQAEYAYPRGRQQITGPSIRLAETCARYWGNLQYGVRELTRNEGGSELEAFCHDLETNVRASRVFHMEHARWTKKSGIVPLEDPRDIYENNANHAARRLRACILEVIPGDVVEAAQMQCRKTLAGDADKPIKDRIKSMAEAFEKIGVTADHIAQRYGKRVDALIETDLVTLRKIYTSLRDGMSKPEDWFDVKEINDSASELIEDQQRDELLGLIPFSAEKDINLDRVAAEIITNLEGKAIEIPEDNVVMIMFERYPKHRTALINGVRGAME